MYIEFFTVNGYEYARTRRSVRKGDAIKHDKGVSLGRVLDKKRLIFQNRSKGVFNSIGIPVSICLLRPISV